MAAISWALPVDDDTTNFLNQTLLQRMAVTGTVRVAWPATAKTGSPPQNARPQ